MEIGGYEIDPKDINPAKFQFMGNEEFKQFFQEFVRIQQQERQENQLVYYQPASERAALVHKSNARLLGVSGGNGSSKTETCLVEILSLATGVFPDSIRDDLIDKFRGPVNCRIVVESLTTVLENIILPKLKWWEWTGVDAPGGERGHWGWIPKNSLIKGSWDASYKAQTRTLHVLCRDPNDPATVLGQSKIQFMSHDQDPASFASGDFHHVLLDEPPRLAIFRENQARTMRVKGRLYLAMTWPDDPTIPVDWIYDEVYDRGIEGPNKWPDIDWLELYTTDNVNLDQEAIASQMEKWDEIQKQVRIYGQPRRFTDRIHPLFTDVDQVWSFKAGENIVPIDGKCPITGSSEWTAYNHVVDMDHSTTFPTVFLLDPHPRKPHMFLWAQVGPYDDIYVVADGQVDDDPTQVNAEVKRVEETLRLNVVARWIDPNMGASPANTKRHSETHTWQEEFAAAGLDCALANDADVGRSRVNEYLRPDADTYRPRLLFHRRCENTIHQMKRYVWDNWKNADEKDLKQKPKDKYDDYPTLLKYLMNSDPSFATLRNVGTVIRRKGVRRGAY